jgi:hypothetical protein
VDLVAQLLQPRLVSAEACSEQRPGHVLVLMSSRSRSSGLSSHSKDQTNLVRGSRQGNDADHSSRAIGPPCVSPEPDPRVGRPGQPRQWRRIDAPSARRGPLSCIGSGGS